MKKSVIFLCSINNKLDSVWFVLSNVFSIFNIICGVIILLTLIISHIKSEKLVKYERVKISRLCLNSAVGSRKLNPLYSISTVVVGIFITVAVIILFDIIIPIQCSAMVCESTMVVFFSVTCLISVACIVIGIFHAVLLIKLLRTTGVRHPMSSAVTGSYRRLNDVEINVQADSPGPAVTPVCEQHHTELISNAIVVNPTQKSGHFPTNCEDRQMDTVPVERVSYGRSTYPFSSSLQAEHITQTCFVLGDVHTLTITHQGGTFPLHPFGPRGGEQQLECCATLEAPPGVVGSGVTVSVHYAIILDGPFRFPEKWKRTSVVLYIDCPDSKLLIEPLKVNLHHWVVSSETSCMCFLKSDHLLRTGQTEFTFKCHANAIPSQPNMASVYLKDHFCLVCIAATSDATVVLRYYGILLSDPLKDRIERFWLCITYAVPSWVQAVAEYFRRKDGSEGYREIPEHEEMQISYGNKVKVDIENQSGLGWTLSVTKKEVFLSDVNTLARYTSCGEREKAVRVGSYPPSMKFTVMYKAVPSPETHEPVENFAHLSSEGGDAISLFFAVQNQNAKDPIVPSAAISDVNMSANGPLQGAWTELTDYNPPQDEHYGEPSKPLTVQHLMPYINDLADEVVSISGWLDMDRELSVIRRTFGMITPREQLQELLKKWLEDIERPTAPQTWEYFVRVVRRVRKGHVADRIVEDVFQDSGLPLDPEALEKYVVSKMADNWYLFGIHLGLSEDTLKAIDKLKIKNSTQCSAMFQQWMEEIGPVENKMDKIEQAMEEVLKVTGDKKSRMTSMCGSEQGEGTSPISNDAIPAWVEKMADNWFNFGIALGFSEEDMQSIKDSNDNDVARCSAMMYRWLRTRDHREKTHERLFRAAKEATPPVVPNGMSPKPPPYSESETVDPEVPHFILEV